MSEEAIKEISSTECLVCGKSLRNEDPYLTLNPQVEELKVLQEKLDKELKERVEIKLKSKKKKRKYDGEHAGPGKDNMNGVVSAEAKRILRELEGANAEKKVPLSIQRMFDLAKKEKVGKAASLFDGTYTRYAA